MSTSNITSPLLVLNCICSRNSFPIALEYMQSMRSAAAVCTQAAALLPRLHQIHRNPQHCRKNRLAHMQAQPQKLDLFRIKNRRLQYEFHRPHRKHPIQAAFPLFTAASNSCSPSNTSAATRDRFFFVLLLRMAYSYMLSNQPVGQSFFNSLNNFLE